MTHRMTIAGVTRDLPICKVTDDLYIGAFIMFGDAEITVACAKELLARAPKDYDYLLTAEAKSIPLIHEMARQSGAKTYFVARKGLKVYLTDPLCVDVNSITTQHEQHLYLSGADAALMRGKRILIVDDVISTGESLATLEQLVNSVGGNIVGKMTVLAEGDAAKRDDITYLNVLPVFNAEFFQRTAVFSTDADNRLNGIIGQPGDGKHYVAWTKNSKQRSGQRMGAGYKMMPHQCVFATGNFGHHRLQRFAAPVIVAVAGASCEMGFADPVVDEGRQHFPAVVFADFLRAGKRRRTVELRLFPPLFQPGIDVKKFLIHGN